MKLALIATATPTTPLRIFNLADGKTELAIRYELPDGSQISPVILDWSNDTYQVLEVTSAVVPEGKRTTGGPSYVIVDGKLVESFELEDIPAPEPTPEPTAADYRLQPWQFVSMVDYLGNQKGIDLDAAILAAIGQIQDPLERSIAKALYTRSDYYERNSPALTQIAPALGLTGAEIDAAWLAIATRSPV